MFTLECLCNYLQDSLGHKAVVHGVSLQLCQACGSDYT